ncbi:MAG: acetyltransferase [Planctomycetaceae bacterium]|nr:acetyltransferase [Planctomycetaceae bacterium]
MQQRTPSRLIIVGAGGFGREVYDWACAAAAAGADWTVEGFLDDNSSALEGFPMPAGILGSAATYEPQADERFVCAIGEPCIKLQIARGLQARGAQFTNVIHPTALVGRQNRLGVGLILCPYSVITTNVTVGDFVTLNLHGTIGHDAVIGDGCTLNNHTDVTGWVTLGEGVFLGSHASVLPHARVGDYARIGAGSTVLRSVKPQTTVIGVPGQRLRMFDPPDRRAG